MNDIVLTLRYPVYRLLVAAMILSSAAASGQSYPNKLIRIMTGEIGGSTDFVSRQIGNALSGPLGQSIIIENRVGIISIETVARSQPDGYTVLVAGTNFWINPLFQTTRYDAVNDFSPITLISTSPMVLVVHPSLPVKSVKELIALAKAKPGELNYASGATGGTYHLASELFTAMAGINILRVNYKGTGAMFNDLFAGQVQMMFVPAPAWSPNAKSGRLKALAVSSAERSTLFPSLPTVAASGLPGYSFGSPIIMVVPAKTPEAISYRLNQEVVRVINRPNMKELFLNAGSEIVSSSPQELAVWMNNEIVRMTKIFKNSASRTE